MRLPGPNLNLDRTSVRFNRFRFRTSVQNQTSASLLPPSTPSGISLRGCVEVRISYTIFRLFTLVVIWLLFLRSFLVPLLELFPSCRSTSKCYLLLFLDLQQVM